jgi:hypothetical protein
VDDFADSDTECRPAADACDVSEFCSGDAPDCPDDQFASEGTPCGPPIASACDRPDTCDGEGTCVDRLAPDGSPCDDEDECTVDDECVGGTCVGDELPAGVFVDMVLVGSNLPVTRCIQFIADDCSEVLNVDLSFIDDDSDPGTPVRYTGTVDLTCGVWSTLCAKDQQHSLWAATTLTATGSTYTADTVLYLDGGDTDDDGDVDIDDVTLLMALFEQLNADGCCTWDGTRDADFDNNGFVGASDYMLLTTSWLDVTACECTTSSYEPGGNRASSVPRLARNANDLPVALAVRADLNADGRVDWLDVKQFETENGLPNALSEALRQASNLHPSIGR